MRPAPLLPSECALLHYASPSRAWLVTCDLSLDGSAVSRSLLNLHRRDARSASRVAAKRWQSSRRPADIALHLQPRCADRPRTCCTKRLVSSTTVVLPILMTSPASPPQSGGWPSTGLVCHGHSFETPHGPRDPAPGSAGGRLQPTSETRTHPVTEPRKGPSVDQNLKNENEHFAAASRRLEKHCVVRACFSHSSSTLFMDSRTSKLGQSLSVSPRDAQAREESAQTQVRLKSVARKSDL